MKLITVFTIGLMTLFVKESLGWNPNQYLNANTVYNLKDSADINKQRLTWVVGGKAVAITGSIIVLDQMWYSDFPRNSFHFEDDILHWKQLDKLGHITSAYHISSAGYKMFRWTGLDNNKSALYGSLASTLFMTSVEILDGFSKEWGFSVSDQAANMLGAGMFYSQQLLWESQKIKPKYSFTSSGLENYRPGLLGSNRVENMLKDYNGMTFWLSMNMNMFSQEIEIFPPWLNIAVGYGGNGMLGSVENPSEHDGQTLPQLERYRQWYLAPDVDFSKINTDSQFLQLIFDAIDFIKMPAPAIEYNSKHGWHFHLVYF